MFRSRWWLTHLVACLPYRKDSDCCGRWVLNQAPLPSHISILGPFIVIVIVKSVINNIIFPNQYFSAHFYADDAVFIMLKRNEQRLFVLCQSDTLHVQTSTLSFFYDIITTSGFFHLTVIICKTTRLVRKMLWGHIKSPENLFYVSSS